MTVEGCHICKVQRDVLSQGSLCSPCPSLLSQTDAWRLGHGFAVHMPHGQEVGRPAGGDLPAAAFRAASKDGWVCRAPIILPHYSLSNRVRLIAKIFFLFVMTFFHSKFMHLFMLIKHRKCILCPIPASLV